MFNFYLMSNSNVQVEVCDLLSKLDPLAASFILPEWSARTSSALMSLLADEDLRVRQAGQQIFLDKKTTIFLKRTIIFYKDNNILKLPGTIFLNDNNIFK